MVLVGGDLALLPQHPARRPPVDERPAVEAHLLAYLGDEGPAPLKVLLGGVKGPEAVALRHHFGREARHVGLDVDLVQEGGVEGAHRERRLRAALVLDPLGVHVDLDEGLHDVLDAQVGGRVHLGAGVLALGTDGQQPHRLEVEGEEALGVPRQHLLLLHDPDPVVPLLVRLEKDGRVGPALLEEAHDQGLVVPDGLAVALDQHAEDAEPPRALGAVLVDGLEEGFDPLFPNLGHNVAVVLGDGLERVGRVQPVDVDQARDDGEVRHRPPLHHRVPVAYAEERRQGAVKELRPEGVPRPLELPLGLLAGEARVEQLEDLLEAPKVGDDPLQLEHLHLAGGPLGRAEQLPGLEDPPHVRHRLPDDVVVGRADEEDARPEAKEVLPDLKVLGDHLGHPYQLAVEDG
mmetsp:Transcript_11813/g.30664  ORF Transcript_11813/g.30664 Transcript_11813/m.30664 type:complete len:404 (+) Transcript_11813:2006-3217(+)